MLWSQVTELLLKKTGFLFLSTDNRTTWNPMFKHRYISLLPFPLNVSICSIFENALSIIMQDPEWWLCPQAAFRLSQFSFCYSLHLQVISRNLFLNHSLAIHLHAPEQNPTVLQQWNTFSFVTNRQWHFSKVNSNLRIFTISSITTELS